MYNTDNIIEEETKEKKPPNEKTLKHCEIVTDVDKLKVDLQATFMKYASIKQWAYINHNKDDTRPHYHIYLNFGDTSVKICDIANWFCVPENLVSKVKGRKSTVLQYLTHSNITQQNKHRYDISEVISNFDITAEIKLDLMIGDFKEHSYAEQLLYISQEISIDQRERAFKKLETLWRLECKTMTLGGNRQMDVIFITGEAGAGKSDFAKDYLKRLKLDYCLSSSSNDPFQDYMGQKGMILDDLRDTVFKLNDLLKILDNHNKSTVASRFNNKVFSGEILIITSIVPIYKWYEGTNEDLAQLFRRIKTYIHVGMDEICVYGHGLDLKTGRPIGQPELFENQIKDKYSNVVENKQLDNINKLYGDLKKVKYKQSSIEDLK